MEPLLAPEDILDQRFQIVGGIYFSPPGFTHQLPVDLAREAGEDFVRTTWDVVTHPGRRPGHVGSYLKYFVETGRGTRRNNVRGVVQECSEINHSARRRKHHAALIFGTHDSLANLNKIVPARYRNQKDGARDYFQQQFYLGDGDEPPPLEVVEVYGGAHHGWAMTNPGEAAEVGWNALVRLVPSLAMSK
jgi:hypothetical protein